jgi:UDP-N-acetylmuramoyl-tripeptide--D-alanyl-D-alanine ligase
MLIMKALFRRLVGGLLEFQALRLFKTHNFKVVGVSGSVGKTSTKLAIATVLEQKYRVLVQQGSFNDEIGLPLACFDLELPGRIFNPLSWIKVLFQMEAALHRPYPYDVLVIEIGTDAPGEVPHTLSYITPDIGVVTAVTPEHMEYFGTLDAVAGEELAIVAGSKQSVVNKDDVPAKYRHKYVDGHPHVYYGLDSESDYSFQLTATDPVGGTTGTLAKHQHAHFSHINFGLYGRHSAKMAAAAYAVGDLLHLTHDQLKAGIESLQPIRGRMNPLAGVNGSIIIDDTYNSSPEAALAALDTLAKTAVTGRRIALMGSMNELGEQSLAYHQEVGAAAAGVDLLVTLGTLANTHLGPAAVAAGLDPTRMQQAASPKAAADYLKLILRPGDVLLAKGSQNGVFAEEAVKLLLADPHDEAKLVRQSPAWLRTKRKQFSDI